MTGRTLLRGGGLVFWILVSAAFCLGPVVWQVITSLKPDAELTSLPPILPENLTLQHYISIFTQHPFARMLGNSLVVAGTTTLLSLFIGSLAAFALAWLGFRGKGVILSVALAVSMFPPISIVSPLYLVIRELELRDTWWALIILHTTFSLPLTLWILTSTFREIPGELYKAAQVEGCTPFQAFYMVLLPLSIPGLVAAALLTFIFSWNEFLFALTFSTTEASRTIPVGIALFPGLHEIPYGEIAAATLVVILPVVFLALIFQKRIVQGLTAGAVKG